jgi:hypothetical protein
MDGGIHLTVLGISGGLFHGTPNMLNIDDMAAYYHPNLC